MAATIEPEPSDAEREAILAVLGAPVEPRLGDWAETAIGGRASRMTSSTRNRQRASVVSRALCVAAAANIQPAPPKKPFCPICVISIKVEVARGLTQLAGYLGAWAAFGEWCNSHQTV